MSAIIKTVDSLDFDHHPKCRSYGCTHSHGALMLSKPSATELASSCINP